MKIVAVMNTIKNKFMSVMTVCARVCVCAGKKSGVQCAMECTALYEMLRVTESCNSSSSSSDGGSIRSFLLAVSI